MNKYFAESELIINADGSIFHLHVTPEHLADKIILVGDPGRVKLVASHFEEIEYDVESREFHTVTGTFEGKRITVISTGIGCAALRSMRKSTQCNLLKRLFTQLLVGGNPPPFSFRKEDT